MSDHDLYVDLPNEVILALALEAHARDITLNQLMVEIIEKKCAEVLGR